MGKITTTTTPRDQIVSCGIFVGCSPAMKAQLAVLGETGTPNPLGDDQAADRTALGPARPDTAPALIGRATSAHLPEWLRVRELAAYRAVSSDTVYRMIARGELNAHRMGRIVRIPREQVLRRKT